MISAEESKIILTLMDVAIRQLGIRADDMPGGLSAIGVVCKKLKSIQDEDAPKGLSPDMSSS